MQTKEREAKLTGQASHPRPRGNGHSGEGRVLSVNTVEYHLKNLHSELGMNSRTQLVLRLRARSEAAATGPGGRRSIHWTV